MQDDAPATEQPHHDGELSILTRKEMQDYPLGGNSLQALVYLSSLALYHGQSDAANSLRAWIQVDPPAILSRSMTTLTPKALAGVVSILAMPRVEYFNTNASIGEANFGSFRNFYRALSGHFYLPSFKYCTFDFIQQFLTNQKVLYRWSEIRHIKMPKYPEVKALTCMEGWGSYPFVMISLPDHIRGDKPANASYFFDIVNTAYPDSMRLLTKALQENRIEVQAATEATQIPSELRAVFAQAPNIRMSCKRRKHTITRCSPYNVSVTVRGAEFRLEYNPN